MVAHPRFANAEVYQVRGGGKHNERKQHPPWAHVFFFLAPTYVHASQVDLDPGDVLFVPMFWFHHVRCLTPSVSVNYFASTPWEMVREGSQRLVRHLLHSVGVIGNGNCVCHASDV